MRHAAQRLEGRHVAAQQRLQVLVQDEAGPDQAAVAEHQREQPDDARRRRLVGEDDWKWAKSTWACWPGGVSKRTSKEDGGAGRISRRKSVTAV